MQRTLLSLTLLCCCLVPLCTSALIPNIIGVATCGIYTSPTPGTILQLTYDIQPVTLGGTCFSLTGADSVVLDGNGFTLRSLLTTGTGIDVQSSTNVTIKNFTIEGSILPINVVGCANCTIVGNTITQVLATASAGIYVDKSDNIEISYNNFNQFNISSCVVHVSSSPGAQITYNEVQNLVAIYSTTFFDIYSSSPVTISNNNLAGTKLQCEYLGASFNSEFIGFNFNNSDFYCTSNTISRINGQAESCSKNFTGFQTLQSEEANLAFYGNLISGIFLVNSPGFTDTVVGFYAESSVSDSAIEFSNNNIATMYSGNVYGISISGAYDATITYNTFSGLIGSASYGIYIPTPTFRSLIPNVIVFGNQIDVSANQTYLLPDPASDECDPEYQYISSACYPPFNSSSFISTLPCCSACIIQSRCVGDVTFSSYNSGSCPSYTECSNFNETHEVELFSLSPNPVKFDSNSASVTVSVTLSGISFDLLPALTFFDRATPVQFDAIQSIITLDAEAGLHEISFSLNGTYDSFQDPIYLLVTNLQSLYLTAGATSVYSSFADPSTGVIYSLCFVSDSPLANGNFIAKTDQSIISPLFFYDTQNLPGKGASGIVASDGTVWIVGEIEGGEVELCSASVKILSSSGNFACERIVASGGYVEVAALLEDSQNRIWVIGSTNGSVAGYSNYGERDIFAIILSGSDKLVSFLQFGTSQDEFPVGAILYEEMNTLYIVGYTYGELNKPYSNVYEQSGFVSEIMLSTIQVGGNVQWSFEDFIYGIGVDTVSNAIVIYGILEDPTKNSTGFVKYYSLDSTGTIIDTTASYYEFGVSGGEFINSMTFNENEGYVIAVGYQRNERSFNGIFYQLVSGEVNASVISNEIEAQSVVYNSFEQSVEIFGSVDAGSESSLFSYIVPSNYFSIVAPLPPTFGKITAYSIEIYWLTPLAKQYQYSLLQYTVNGITTFQTDGLNYLLLSSLSGTTAYYFAVQISGNFTGSPLISPVAAATTLEDCTNKPFTCQSGSCVSTLLQCVSPNLTTCPPSLPYLCLDNTCAETPVCGYKLACIGYSCWNGGCADTPSHCPPVPSCPPLTHKCYNGKCAAKGQLCPLTTCNQVCPDGSCAPCGSSFGCPSKVPFLCPNGSCVETDMECMEGCNYTAYLCFDGTCQENYTLCPTPPRLNYPISFSYAISPPNTKRDTDSSTNISVPILSNSLLQIANIELPLSLFTSPSAPDQYSLEVSSVPDSDMYDVGFGEWENLTYGAALYSAILSLTIEGLMDFSDPVKIAFINELPIDFNVSHLCMAFINRTSQQWQFESEVQVDDESRIVGYTSHFTEFAVMFAVKPPSVNHIDDSDFEKIGKIDKNTVGIYVVSGVLLVYLVALFFAIRSDRRRPAQKALREALASPVAPTGTFSNFSVDPSNDSVTENSTPGSPDTASSPPTASPSALALKPDTDGKVKDELGNVVGWRTLFVRRFPEKHSWLAVYFRSSNRANITHTDLLTLLFCMVWANLMISSLLFTNTDPYAIGQKIVNGICVACIVFPITIIFSIMFHRMPPKYKWVTYVLAISFCLVCAVLTLIETLKFGNSATKTWIISISVSTVQDGLINQPIKLFFTCLIILLHPTASLVAFLL